MKHTLTCLTTFWTELAEDVCGSEKVLVPPGTEFEVVKRGTGRTRTRALARAECDGRPLYAWVEEPFHFVPPAERGR